jgi:signal transduction histidine kinase
MARVLGEGTGAEEAVVWLRVGDSLRPTAVWPADVAAPTAPPPDAVDVVHHGDVLGAVSVRMPANDPMNPTKAKLVDDLAAQAGLVLMNVGLTAELRTRLNDLKAAQKRLVSAQDHERRHLERNIHDGAQQQLVALAVKARLARQLTERDPAKAGELLEQIEAETQTALEDLRDLARGIYPPLLADQGLAAALEAQARKSPVPVTVEDPDGVGRYQQEVEAAVYFSVLEALQNVAKHAGATAVTIEVEQQEAVLVFRVVDDGCGFEVNGAPSGTGLQGIADRLGALDGVLRIESTPGAGTTLTGSIPVDAGGAAHAG